MADLLGIGSSALLAYRSALNVVGQNVSNANTDGYSRQRIELQSTAVNGVAAGSAAGVNVSSTQRMSDRFVLNQLVTQDSSYARISTFESLSSQLDGWLSNTDTGLSSSLQTFFDSLNSLSADASSSATRQVVLQSASSLAARFKDLQQNVSSLGADIDARLATSTTQINSLAQQIAQLNDRIGAATAASAGQAPNELLDQRDQVLRQLADQVGVSTSTAADGALNVFIGNGQALVLGNRTATLSVQPDEYGRPRELTLDAGGMPVSVTQQLSGGIVGGLMDFRREVLDPAAGELGRMAVALSSAVNAQNAAGMNQYGQLGGALFNLPTGTVTASRNNTGGASVGLVYGETSKLTAKDYVLAYDGASWSLSDAATGASVVLSGDGSSSNPFVADGMKLTLSGGAAAGDKFLLQASNGAAAQIGMATADTAAIAAASPLKTVVSTANTGQSQIGAPQVIDAATANLLSTVSIQFTSANTYSLNGAGSYAYTSGSNIEVNGWRVSITGTPASGDAYTLQRNDGTSGDNGNAQALKGLADAKLLDGARSTLASVNTALVAKVGAQSAQAATQATAQSTLRDQTQALRDSVSGVNLDEEAADLIRFQQAYQAAAQIVSAANTLFDSLLAAVRR